MHQYLQRILQHPHANAVIVSAKDNYFISFFRHTFLGLFLFPKPIPPANMITLSYPSRIFCSLCSKVKTEPAMSGCPNLFPKSDAPLEALIKMSTGFGRANCVQGIFLFYALLEHESRGSCRPQFQLGVKILFPQQGGHEFPS